MTEGRSGIESHGASASNGTATAGKMKAQLGAAAGKTREKIDNAREPIADRLLGAADRLRTQGARLPGGAANVARGAADRLEASATYLVSHDAQEILDDVVAVVRDHPVQSLLIAGALGYLLGRALRRD